MSYFLMEISIMFKAPFRFCAMKNSFVSYMKLMRFLCNFSISKMFLKHFSQLFHISDIVVEFLAVLYTDKSEVWASSKLIPHSRFHLFKNLDLTLVRSNLIVC